MGPRWWVSGWATVRVCGLAACALGVAVLAGSCARGSGGEGSCGDGVRDDPEQCDNLDLGGADCASLGMGSGSLKCRGDCTYDPSGCSSPFYCGNGVREGAELCDGLDLGVQTCESLNLGTGTLLCTATCQFDASGCSMVEQCGNGVVEGNEDCDGYNLHGKTCATLGLGFTGGELACTTACRFATSACTTTGPVCGNDVLEPPERCDGETFQGGATCVSLGFGGGNLACSSSCQFDTSGCTTQAEICDNGIDDDGDGYIDCNDGDCRSSTACGGSTEVCNNGIDDDGDGYIDCDDADCSGDAACQSSGSEICDNGIDDDGIFGCDCADVFSCFLDFGCLLAPATETDCSDGQDDDLDCLVDCDDPDCSDDPACSGPQEICGNTVDDDGDGLVDCDDPDCAGQGSCGVCSAAPALTCGQPVSGTTVGGPSHFSSEYGCGSYDETGPEAYYRFTPTADAQVAVDLTGQGSADLELLLVGQSDQDCDPVGHCLDASQESGGTEHLEFTALAGTTYYVIVEGYSGDSGAFTLELTCQ